MKPGLAIAILVLFVLAFIAFLVFGLAKEDSRSRSDPPSLVQIQEWFNERTARKDEIVGQSQDCVNRFAKTELELPKGKVCRYSIAPSDSKYFQKTRRIGVTLLSESCLEVVAKSTGADGLPTLLSGNVEREFLKRKETRKFLFQENGGRLELSCKAESQAGSCSKVASCRITLP